MKKIEPAKRGIAARPSDLAAAKQIAIVMGIKQVDLLGVLIRCWNETPLEKRGAFIPRR